MEWEKYEAEQEKILAGFEAKNKEAKEQGILIGRIYSEGIADGKALYQVAEIIKSKVKLIHIDVYDGYTIDWIERMGRAVPLKIVKANIENQDALNEIFGGKR